MKTLRKKLTSIGIFLIACAMIAIGLLCVYKPIRAGAATTAKFEYSGFEYDENEEEYKIVFQTSLTASDLTLLKSGRTVSNAYYYTDYFLSLSYSSGARYYHVEQSDYLPDTDGAYFKSGYETVSSPYPYEYYLSSDFVSGGSGKIGIAVPSDLKTEYAYSCRIVKVTYRVAFDQAYAGSTTIEDEKQETVFSLDCDYGAVYENVLNELSDGAELMEAERKLRMEMLGVSPSADEISVTLKYKELADYATVTERSYPFKLSGVYAYSKEHAVSTLYALSDYSNIADFNVVYTGNYYEEGYVYETQKRIILQAEDFNYSYDFQTETGSLEVVYRNYQYKDLSIRIENNDPANPLIMDYYTSNVSVAGNTVTITYNFRTIEEQLLNACLWLFQLDRESFIIGTIPEAVRVTLTEESLTVVFPFSAENSLINLSLRAVVEIVEDIPYTLTYKYVQLGYKLGELTETWKTSETIESTYTTITRDGFENFMTKYGDIVRAAVNPEILGGAEYYIPVSIQKNYSAYDSEEHVCEITVVYDYNTLFQITNNINGEVTFKALNHSSLVYTGDYFVSDIPSEYRVESLSTTEAYKDKLTITNAEKYAETKIEVRTNTNAKEILPIVVNFTDSWKLIVSYLENYADWGVRNGEKDEDGKPVKPSFAEKKVFSGTVKVADVADIYHPTNAEMSKILGLDSLDILGLATVESITVTFDGISAYTASLAYSYAALKQIDYNGNVKEIKIPLTSYADWCEEYGKDWSILYLNTTTRHFFKYSNDVTRENLYGFFSVAVFKEQVSDLNFYFENNTGDGCMTIYSSGEVRGSGVYKFFSRLGAKGGFLGPLLGIPLISTMCMNLCELADDDNAIYYSYFFFLDGTSDNPYLSNGGADSADDTDSAIKNAIDDAKDWIKEKWEQVNGSMFAKVVKIIAGIMLLILALSALFAGVYKLLVWAGVIKPKPKTKTTTPKKRKTTSKRKKKTKAKK